MTTENTFKLETPRRLATVANTAAEFALAGETPAGVRANIFRAKTRHSTRGPVCGNGLEEMGAIVRRGRKVLIDLDLYGAWLAGKRADTTIAG